MRQIVFRTKSKIGIINYISDIYNLWHADWNGLAMSNLSIIFNCMKRMKIIIALVLLASITTFGQRDSKIPLLGQKAPTFTGKSTQGTINFPDDFGKDWKVILSHPQDFTPVCTSELLELARLQDDFKDLGVEIVVISTDMLSQHEKWVEAMEDISKKVNDPVKIEFPLVDDNSKAIAEKYGMLHDHSNSARSVRGVYIIDPQNNVRFTQFYPVEVGRSMHEIKRAIIALQTAEKNDVVIPSDWSPGDDVLLYHYQKKDLEDPNVNEVDWFLIYKSLTSSIN